MSARISRRRLAKHAAERIFLNDENIADQLAAYLVKSARVRELELLVRDIEYELIAKGELVVGVQTAKELSLSIKKELIKVLSQTYGVKQVSLRQTVSKSLLGGIKITTPDAVLDNTLSHRLQKLKVAKV